LVALLLEALHLRLGFLQQFLQSLAAAKRSRAGAGANANTVLGDAVKIDQTLATEYTHRVRQHLLEEVAVLDAEVGEGVGVDKEAACKPEVGIVVDAQVGQSVGAFDASQGGI